VNDEEIKNVMKAISKYMIVEIKEFNPSKNDFNK